MAGACLCWGRDFLVGHAAMSVGLNRYSIHCRSITVQPIRRRFPYLPVTRSSPENIAGKDPLSGPRHRHGRIVGRNSNGQGSTG